VIASGYFEGYTEATNQTWALDTSDPDAEWRRMDDFPIKLGVTHAATIIVGSKMYIIGGYLGGNWGVGGIGQEVDFALEYDHQASPGEQWRFLPHLPAGRAGGGGFYSSTEEALVFAAGAVRPQEKSRDAVDKPDTWMLNLNNLDAGWVLKADSPLLANHLQYATAIDSSGDERHYIMGGQIGKDEHDGNVDTMYEYSFEANEWIARANMPIPRSHASSSTRAYGCGLLIISGTTNGNQRTSDISYYEPSSDTWRNIGQIPIGLNTPVCDISYLEDGDWLYCETGWTAGDYSYKVQIVPN